MRFAITGHTSGIGLSLINKLKYEHETMCFSRSNGYDINDSNTRSKIIEMVKDTDVFINNAYDFIGQNKLLEEVLNVYNDTSKCVINISSNIVNVPESTFTNDVETLNYRSTKIMGNNIILNYTGPVRIINVLPDLVKTNFYLGLRFPNLLEKGMSPDYIADIILQELYGSKTSKELIIKYE